MFRGVMALQRRYSHQLARRLLGLAFVAACLLALALGEGSAAAARVQTAGAQHRVAGVASAADTRAQGLAALRASLRALHRAADRSVAKPADPFLRLGFTVNVVATPSLRRWRGRPTSAAGPISLVAPSASRSGWPSRGATTLPNVP